MDDTPVERMLDDADLSPDEVFAEVARRQLEVQVSASDVLDSRISAAFGVGSTVLPVTIGLLNLLQASLPAATKVMLAGALVAYGAQITCAAVVFLNRWRDLVLGPNIEALQGYSTQFSGAQLRRWVADETVRAIGYNEEVLRRKGRWALGVIAALYVEAALLSLAAFFTIF